MLLLVLVLSSSSFVALGIVNVSAWVLIPQLQRQRYHSEIRHRNRLELSSTRRPTGDKCYTGPFTVYHRRSNALFLSSSKRKSNNNDDDNNNNESEISSSKSHTKKSPSSETGASLKGIHTSLQQPPPPDPKQPFPIATRNNTQSSSNSTMMNPNNLNRTTQRNNNNNNNSNKNNSTRVRQQSNSSGKTKNTTTAMTSKQELVKAVGESIKATRQKQQQKQQQQQQRIKPITATDTLSDGTVSTTTPRTGDGTNTKTKTSSLLNQLLNPYEAGQKLRQSIETTITSIQTQTDPNKSMLQQSQYYIDDRFMERGTLPPTTSSTSWYSTAAHQKKRAALLPWEEPETAFIPEILVVGATGRLGRLIVRQLLQQSSSSSSSSSSIKSSTGIKQQQVPKVRVRVLVRDLYTRTLDILGTGVTYCQGDLLKIDTLEDAVTDIDKLVFVASASSSAPTNVSGTEDEQEEQYQRRIQMAEQIDYIGMSNLISAYQNVRHADYGTSQAAKRSLFKFQDRNREDFFLFSIDDGDDNDGGTIVADADNMYSTDGDDQSTTKSPTTSSARGGAKNKKPVVMTTSYDDEYDNYDDTYRNILNTDEYTDIHGNDEDIYVDSYDEYNENDDEDDYEAYATSLNNIERRSDASVVKTQSQWIRNSFDHGVFVGRIPQTTPSSRNHIGGEAAIISSRLRSRDDPEMGIELGPNFAGFICRVCSDGNMYEAFVRTGSYATNGIEYVCEFTTSTKNPTTSTKGAANASRNKFLSVRLPFSSFKPVQRNTVARHGSDDDSFIVPPFRGYDVRQIGFRYRSSTNSYSKIGSNRIDRKTGIEWNRFYLAISYIKVYRSQPEPEFVYVSDARIPHIVHDHMIEHESKQILPYSEASLQTFSNRYNGAGLSLLQSGTEIQLELRSGQISPRNAITRTPTTYDRTIVYTNMIPEETYYKYRGEELLKKSGLSYAIVRIGELCDSPASLDDMNDIILSPSIISSLSSSTSVDEATGNDKQSNSKSNALVAISRADIAQICVQALLDPNALNKSFYVYHTADTPSTGKEDMSTKLASLPTDRVP